LKGTGTITFQGRTLVDLARNDQWDRDEDTDRCNLYMRLNLEELGTG
jgi:hypothetical protein